ncbi:PREDICTED: uncharacterized protein LOC105451272 isoform X2 [Wasmannia auropunctata]|uniref:uncharacterized protein LOC105451272 isoform X2 n=1 Tax=Wasmannia auropunctata TaxID=64793 RepID=UPI0005F0B4D9|nr:PREDICTED: uncharacterized protein LOC105451272 isoform X2 [Wasmannia auropunctata]
MLNAPEKFVSIMHHDFIWPYAKSPKPPSPPMDTTGIQPYLLRPDPEDCKCDIHGFEAGKTRYRQLADKERRLVDELTKVNCEMTDLTSSMLGGDCDMEEAMKSIYKTDYEKRGLPVTRYRSLMAAIDSPVGSPITPAIIDLKDAYRDPTRFRSSAMESLTIQPVKTRHLLNDKRVPGTCSFWTEQFTGCSEYMDTISKMGLTNMKNQQRYLAPLPVLRKIGVCNSSIKN